MPLASPEILAFLDGPSPRRSAGLLSRMLSDDPHSYDLLPSSDSPLSNSKLSLEDKLDIIFGPRHLRLLLNNPSYLSLFASFIKSQRPTESIHLLIFYLDTKKALRAIAYANAISSELDYIEGLAGLDRSETGPPRIKTVNHELERKAGVAFKELMEVRMLLLLSLASSRLLMGHFGI